jgi:hypothetical protein
MKTWQTGSLQGVMGQVVGCGVGNVMVALSVYKFPYGISSACPALYDQFCAILIQTNIRCDEIWYAVFFKGLNYVST